MNATSRFIPIFFFSSFLKYRSRVLLKPEWLIAVSKKKNVFNPKTSPIGKTTVVIE
jgi:hypothetical protein